MAVLSLVIGSITLFAGGFAVWYAVWHRRVEAAFERVPVERGRSVHVLRQGVTLDRDSR
jgi:surfactin synthase thioesterase subunit